MIPQMIVLVWCGITIGAHCIKDGEPTNSKYSGTAAFIVQLINLLILWWGGFFEVMLK